MEMTKVLNEAEQRKSLERILVDATVKPIAFSYDFLYDITNEFEDEIARGGFAVVYKGVVRTGKVAVKDLNKSDKDLDKNYVNELRCLALAKHKNIVKFVGYCNATLVLLNEWKGASLVGLQRHRYLCFEYAPNQSLYHYLEDKPPGGRDWSTCYHLINGICNGLAYLHENKMNHLDLKPANVLLDADLVPKITDFGLARIFDKDQSSLVAKDIIGTNGYAAPEFVESGVITFKTDIYSLGIIIINILRGSNDVPGDEKWHESVNLEGPNVKSCIEIAQKCIDHEECKRPSIADIIKSLNEMESPIKELSDKNNGANTDFTVVVGQDEQNSLEVNQSAPYLPASALKNSSTPSAWTIEMHPTEPWIMITSGDTYVYIWNYKTQGRQEKLRLTGLVAFLVVAAFPRWYHLISSSKRRALNALSLSLDRLSLIPHI